MAALFASCVAEPVLASLGGGGFLLAHQPDREPVLYDFFTQTPRHRKPLNAIDFHPITADFGTAQQEFHIGMGAIATPGVIRGLFAIHRSLCRMPLARIIEPACEAARQGLAVNDFQHYIAEIVSPILLSSEEALRLHSPASGEKRLADTGEIVRQPDMADFFEQLTREGEDLFYQGEVGRTLIDACRSGGGYLTSEDLGRYRVVPRPPLQLKYHAARLYTNPPPSVGGTLIAFSLALLEEEGLAAMTPCGYPHLLRIARAQQLAQQLRADEGADRDLDQAASRRFLGRETIERYRRSLRDHPAFSRGTTQISIIDTQGNLASMTLSNGEGAGYVIPGTGIMMNNMLGEEDINPHGFHRWPENRRIASMMSPTLILSPDGGAIATGSGGSNRIRSAILQVLVNLLEFRMPAEQAVEQPRLHYENGLLNVERGPDAPSLERLFEAFPRHRLWPDKNLFFGGAHTVAIDAAGELSGKGDSRRGGVALQR
ncbi:MAG TPA: gamma-glutamyltransferase [Anaerolineae bacterium]|nr:gamma-glutamyltransferase [Anaerolineae bacterium]